MLTLLFLLWSLIRSITKSVTGRVSPPHSLTPEEGGFSGQNVEEHSVSTTAKMGQGDAGTYHNGK